MAKFQIFTKLTIITLLFAVALSKKQAQKRVSVANNQNNPGLTGEQTDCVDAANVAGLVLKNVQKLNISLPEEYTIDVCQQAIKLGEYAKYHLALTIGGEKCEFTLHSKFGNFEKRKPTTETLEAFTHDATDCNDRIARRKLREVVEKIEQHNLQKNNIESLQNPAVNDKLMAGLTGDAVMCSDFDKVGELFMKNAKRLNLNALKYYNVVDCVQQFKIGQYAKYQLTVQVGETECDFFMHSLATNFNQRKPIKANEESFKREFKECAAKISKANEGKWANAIRDKVDNKVVDMMIEAEIEKVVPSLNQDELDNQQKQNLVDIVAEEIADRVQVVANEKQLKLAGFTGEVTDCVNQESVAQLFEDNARKLKNALTQGYSVVECKQAIKLGSSYNYALLLDYDGQQCELYLESKQLVFNKRMPTKATQQQFIDLVNACNDLVATSEFDPYADEESSLNSSIDNSSITDLIQFMGKEIEIAEQLENLYNQINGEVAEYDMNKRFNYLFFDNTPINLDLMEVLERNYEQRDFQTQPLMIMEQESSSDENSSFNSSLNSSTTSSFYSDFDEDDFERKNNLFGIAGGSQPANWGKCAHMFADLVVADLVQGKVVYKQNVLECNTQVFAGVMTSAVFSFDGVVCEIKAFRAARSDAHLQLYHDGVYEGDQNSVLLPSLEFSPYKHDNCADVFGTETFEFLLNHS